MPMNNRLLRPLQTPGLLDLVPGAAAAYSLRSLSRSYADPVVTVRRSSDDAEDSFTAGEVADGTLAAFCGAGDGFVKQWWDQSNNANHAVAAADTNEPKIVDSGVVVTDEGKPAIQFDGTDDYLTFSGITSLHPWTIAEVKKRPTAGTIGPMFASSGTPTVYSYWQFSDNIIYVSNRSSGYISLGSAGTDQILTFVENPSANKADMRVYRNSVLLPASLGGGGLATTAAFDQIGRAATTNYGNGFYQEIIMWSALVTSQRELIEGNIAWGWSV